MNKILGLYSPGGIMAERLDNSLSLTVDPGEKTNHQTEQQLIIERSTN